MVWLASAPLICSSFFTWMILTNEEWFVSFEWFQWAIFFIISVLTMTLACTPTTYVAVVSGYFLGYWAIIPVVISYQLACALGYALARKIDQGFVKRLSVHYPRISEVIGRVQTNQLSIALLSRLSPALPFALMNLVLSTAGLRFRQFFFGGLLGMLPRTVFSVWVGVQSIWLIDALEEGIDWWLFILISGLAFAMIYLILRPRPRSH